MLESIYPSQIRRWKRSFDEIDEIQAMAAPEDERVTRLITRNTSNKKQRVVGGGRQSEFGEFLTTKLKEYFDKQRDENLSVFVQLFIIEARCLDLFHIVLRVNVLRIY